ARVWLSRHLVSDPDRDPRLDHSGLHGRGRLGRLAANRAEVRHRRLRGDRLTDLEQADVGVAGGMGVSERLVAPSVERLAPRLLARRGVVLDRPVGPAEVGRAGGNERVEHFAGAVDLAQLDAHAVRGLIAAKYLT